jgi:fructan beta-fructosidase
MFKRFALFLLIFLLLGCRSASRSQPTPTPMNNPVAPLGETGPTDTPEPTQEPRTPQDYLATSVARNEPEYPLSTADRYQQVFRPQYHFSAVKGWLGDPDGMVRFNGIYQLFWWGHAESKDLVHWNERIQPMIGDDGSFTYYSGSVVVDKQNSSGLAVNPNQPPMIALYTMHDRASGKETQGLSVSYDYKSFIYFDQNPVLASDQSAFRDPQVFYYAATGRWIMIIALSDDRKVSFYSSKDLKHWDHLSDFGPVGAQSQVWEVPDLFQLSVDGNPNNKKWVLLCGMGPNREQYFIGDFDGEKFTLDPAFNGYLLRGEGLPGQVFADFENGLPNGWTVAGDKIAIGSGNNLGSYHVSGFIGSKFLSTYNPETTTGDRGKVTVTSPAFTISQAFINFLISGGNYPDHAAVNLLVDGLVVRSATGEGTDIMKWTVWDVSEFMGKQAQVQIFDDKTVADFGHINVDQFMFSPTPALSGHEHANWLDFGADYYAVRTYRDYDNVENRVVTMGWLGNWEYANDVPTFGGQGELALPREIGLQSYAGGLHIVQRPVPALEGLRQAPVQIENRVMNGVSPLSEFKPTHNTYEIDATFVITDPGARFGITTTVNGNYGVSIGYDARTSTLFLDRMNSENAGFNTRFAKYMTAPLAAQDGKIRLHIFVDQSSIEVFANDGVLTMSALMFPNPDSLGIELFGENGGANLLSLTAWSLDSIWGMPAK